MPKKLLIIGNGFDLHQHLKSSFNDFFKMEENRIVFYDKNNINDQKNMFFRLSNANKDIPFKDSLIKYIKTQTESHFNLSEIVGPQYKINEVTNFWCLYFKELKKCPQFSNGNDILNFKEKKQTLTNWSDIEYHIAYLLIHTEKVFKKYVDCAIYDENNFNNQYHSDKNMKKLFNEYEQCYLNNNKITYDGALMLLAVKCALVTNWKPTRDSIYDFISMQLDDFEDYFRVYLQIQLHNLNLDENYIKSSQKFAKKLTNQQDYNLINFNYTTFYNQNDPNKINIHSTLQDGDYPIFGISSDLGNNKLIYQKPYYRFSKIYQIMQRTNVNSIKKILPKNIDEIIFYGHSLARADYFYFDTIFTEYNIYSSDIKITFKYSTDFGEKYEIKEQQFKNVYRLINQFAEHINIPNLLPKLLLENRLNIEEVPEDSKKTSTD